jgi:purine-binding chemotaxis protein CheW
MTSSTSERAPSLTGQDDEGGTGTYVIVDVGGTRYCLDVGHVHGVVPPGTVTRVPGARSAIRGVINVRGRVLPLGDLAVVLGAGPARDDGRDPATVVLLGPRHADVPALAVLGEVLDIVELDLASVEPPPPFGLGAAAPLVTGVARLAVGGLALVIDPGQLLAAMGAGEGPQ